MKEFDERQKTYMDAKSQHNALLQKLDKVLAGESLADARVCRDIKRRMTVRKVADETAASEEILTQARRKIARAVKTQIEEEANFAATRENIARIYWCRVLAGIQIEWHQLVAEYLKYPGNDEMRRIKAEFLDKYNL